MRDGTQKKNRKTKNKQKQMLKNVFVLQIPAAAGIAGAGKAAAAGAGKAATAGATLKT